MRPIAFLWFSILLFPAPQLSAEEAELRRIADRNYTLGVKTFAYVGAPVVRVKDYWVRRSQFSALKSPTAFEVSRWPFGVIARVPADTDMPVASQNPDGSKRVQVPLMFGVQMIVGIDGRFTGKAVTTDGTRMGFSYKVTPEVTLVPSVGTAITEPSRGFTNFELLYGGVTKDEIKLSYREYTPDDLARPAFSQEIAYAPDSATIRFRDVVIAVESVDNEKIVYSVLSDGL
jgi:hypothetical protein